MIPNIVRGGRFLGLMMYLQGAGRSNEHTDPHVVAAGDGLNLQTGALTADRARSIADHLDEPRIAFGVRVERLDRKAAQAAIETGTSSAIALAESTHATHVWHCSLSLNPDEGVLSDEKWSAIARDFITEMGFDNPADERAPARWVAVRHGLSKNGGDHIHIAASVVRDDGTKVHTFKDFENAQKTCRALELRHGLTLLASRDLGIGTRGLKPAELAQQDQGHEPARHSLERRVRAHAFASKTEGEWIRRVRNDGLVIRPRYAHGGREEVVGYSVALAPSNGKAIFYGGGKLAKDLTLPRLRDNWDSSPESAAQALDEWRAVSRRERSSSVGVEARSFEKEYLAKTAPAMQRWNAELDSVPFTDRGQWAHISARTAAVFSAWSTRSEPLGGPLAAASRTLSKDAAVRAGGRWRAATSAPEGSASRATAMILLQASTHDWDTALVLLLEQLMQTSNAIARAHYAAGDASRALEVETMVRTQLQTLHAAVTQTLELTRPVFDREAEEARRFARRGLDTASWAPEPAASVDDDDTDSTTTRTTDRGVER